MENEIFKSFVDPDEDTEELDDIRPEEENEEENLGFGDEEEVE